MERVCRAAAWTVFAVLQVSLAYGQTTATLRGQVRDAQGAAVPSATVTVTSRAPGSPASVPTAGDGTFVVANLPPAIVDLTVSASGFAEAKRTGLVLEVGQTAAVDIELTVAGVQETVDVAVERHRRSTRRARSSTRSSRRAPSKRCRSTAATSSSWRCSFPATRRRRTSIRPRPTPSSISSAGQLGRGGNITIDGADNNDDVVGGPLQNVTQEVGAGVSDCHQPLLGRVGPVRLVRDQRRDQVRHRPASRLGVALRARQQLAGPAGDVRSVGR